MSGSRCKALRREYARRFGYPPEKTRWDTRFFEHAPSIWRRVKKGYSGRHLPGESSSIRFLAAWRASMRRIKCRPSN